MKALNSVEGNELIRVYYLVGHCVKDMTSITAQWKMPRNLPKLELTYDKKRFPTFESYVKYLVAEVEIYWRYETMQMFKACDTNKDGVITFDEYWAWSLKKK